MYAEKAFICRTPYITGASFSLGFLLNATNLKFDIAFMVTQDITLAKVNFKTTTITGSPTATIRIETDTAGRPSGSLVAASCEATGVAIANGWQTEVTLGATCSLVRGVVYHLVIANDHGTAGSNHFTVNDQAAIDFIATAADLWRAKQGWTASYNGSAWANRNGGIYMLVNSGATVYMGQPVDATGLQTLHSSTMYGMKFTARFGGSCEGVVLSHLPNTGTIITARLYTAADTLVASGTLPTAVYTIKGNTRHTDFIVFDDGPAAIVSGTSYRIVFLDAGAADRIEYVTTPSSPDYRLVAPIMQECQWTTGTVGSWAETSGKVIQGMGLAVDSVSAGGSGPTIVNSRRNQMIGR